MIVIGFNLLEQEYPTFSSQGPHSLTQESLGPDLKSTEKMSKFTK